MLFSLDNLPGGGGGGGDGAPSVVRSFTLDAHLTRCKAWRRGGFIASGGADDLIRVWHRTPTAAPPTGLSLDTGFRLVSRVPRSSSAIGPTRLVGGGVDGPHHLVRGQWDSLKTLKAHRGGVPPSPFTTPASKSPLTAARTPSPCGT